MALWSGRFEEGVSEFTQEYGASLPVDKAMYKQDIAGSKAHATMLAAQGVISSADAQAICAGLDDIERTIDAGEFVFDINDEDIHMAIEKQLIADIGDAGARLHTGRSRNDQVVTDTRLFAKARACDLMRANIELRRVLVEQAKENFNVILPGYTHLQHAQPVFFAHHLLAYAHMFARDFKRLRAAYDAADVSPLGSAALAGTTYPLDRRMTANLLGFSNVTANSLDAVSDRDFLLDLSYAASVSCMHLSRLAEEVVLWSTSEFGYITLSDAFSTGSSIMPQKKNPDIAELVRGKTGSVIGALVTMLTMTKGLPLTYNRDLQEDKRPVMDSMATVISCCSIMAKVISTTEFHADRMLEVTSRGQINATDLADYLVTKGVPFREAHGIVGAAVRRSIDTRVNLEDMTLDELREFSDRIDKDVYDVLPVVRCVERRDSYGGTSPASTDVQISQAIEQMMLRDEVVRQETQLISNCWKALSS